MRSSPPGPTSSESNGVRATAKVPPAMPSCCINPVTVSPRRRAASARAALRAAARPRKAARAASRAGGQGGRCPGPPAPGSSSSARRSSRSWGSPSGGQRYLRPRSWTWPRRASTRSSWRGSRSRSVEVVAQGGGGLLDLDGGPLQQFPGRGQVRVDGGQVRKLRRRRGAGCPRRWARPRRAASGRRAPTSWSRPRLPRRRCSWSRSRICSAVSPRASSSST